MTAAPDIAIPARPEIHLSESGYDVVAALALRLERSDPGLSQTLLREEYVSIQAPGSRQSASSPGEQLMNGYSEFNRSRAREERCKAASTTAAGDQAGHLALARIFEARAAEADGRDPLPDSESASRQSILFLPEVRLIGDRPRKADPAPPGPVQISSDRYGRPTAFREAAPSRRASDGSS